MKKQLLKSMLMAVVGVGLLAGGALAFNYIEGEVSMTGILVLTGATDLTNANKIFLTSTGIDIKNDTAYVSYATSDLAGLQTKNLIFNDIPFASFSSMTPLWSYTVGPIFSFDLNSLSIEEHSTTVLSLSGNGILYGSGYDPTPGTWTFTTSRPKSNLTGYGTFGWQSGTTASPVPEPATMLLFGTGIAGLAGIVRRRKANKA